MPRINRSVPRRRVLSLLVAASMPGMIHAQEVDKKWETGRVFQEMMMIEGAQYHFIPKGGEVPPALLEALK